MRSFALIPFFLSTAVSAYKPDFMWNVQGYSGDHCDGNKVGEEWREDRTDQCITIDQWQDSKSFEVLGTNHYTFYKDADCRDFLKQLDGWQGCANTGPLDYETQDSEPQLSQVPRSFRVEPS